MRRDVSGRASLPIVMREGRGLLNVAMSADPTGPFGVGVSRFAIEGDSYSSFRQSDHHAVSLQLSGPVAASVRFEGRSLQHRPGRGSLGICPAGADGTAEVRGSFRGIFLRVSSECLTLATAQLGRHGNALVECMSGQDDVIFALGQALEAEARTGCPNGLLYWTSIADALIRRLATRHVAAKVTPPRGSLDAKALVRLDEHIRAHLDASLDIDSLAAVAGCDRFRFARGFRAATGLTPHRYVTRLRLDSAFALVRSKGATLADVALTTGFCDQSHLTRWFRQVYGFTPGAIAGASRACKNIQDRRTRRAQG